MKVTIVIGMVLLPHMLFADTDCWIKEYPDHYLAVCNGDESKTAAAVAAQPTAETQLGTLRQDVQQNYPVYSDNAPRFGRMSKSRVEAAISARNKLLREKELPLTAQ